MSKTQELNIFIIDDNEADRALIKRRITRPGRNIAIREAGSGAEALDIFQQAPNDFDCVFLDYMLPDMDGISLLKRIYDEDTDLTPFPIVMLTGQGSEAVAIDAIRYGAQDYLIKDNISTDTLYIAFTKAREVFELKNRALEARTFLEHSQKMQAVSQLTAGIAHDFNNLLTIIFGNTRLMDDLLTKESLDKEGILKRLKTLQKATQRGAELVKRLMLFSRQHTLKPTFMNINDLVTEIVELLQHSLGPDIDFDFYPAEQLHPVNIDPGQLELALMNMCINARDAMAKDGGTLTIQTKNTVLDDDRAANLQVPSGAYTELIVRDTGDGISPDELDKIFEPFFSMKKTHRNPGLGLSMVYSFAKESNGAIEVQSTRERGTEFHLYFPKAEKDNIESLDLQRMDKMNGGKGETILVVEDEEEILFFITEILQKKGYKVLGAANANEALTTLQRNDRPIHLIVTDIVMPGNMNGYQMAAQVQTMQPDIKLLFTSGYSSGEASQNMTSLENRPMLQKPYQPEELILRIRHILDS